MTVQVHGDGTPFWMVLGQSQSDGWRATTSTGVDLGSSTLIDGYANGWYVPGAAARGLTTITLTWEPQRVVTTAISVSAATLVVSVVLIVLPGLVPRVGRRRRRRSPGATRIPPVPTVAACRRRPVRGRPPPHPRRCPPRRPAVIRSAPS